MEIITVQTAQHCEQCGRPTLNRIHTARGAVCGICFVDPPLAPVVEIAPQPQRARRLTVAPPKRHPLARLFRGWWRGGC